MIIGKSLTALGGGGLKPEIIVTAKAGALLNLHYKDSSIILQTYQLGESETQHTFAVNVSETAYVVEDVTNGKSVEVLVDAVAQYSVQIEYELYLYKAGDQCEDITGGWSSTGYTDGNNDDRNNFTVLGPFTADDTSMYANAPSVKLRTYLIGTNNIIDMSRYQSIHIDATVLDNSRTTYTLNIADVDSAYVRFGLVYYDSGDDISGAYLLSAKSGGTSFGSAFHLSKSHSTSNRVTIHNVWLDKEDTI